MKKSALPLFFGLGILLLLGGSCTSKEVQAQMNKPLVTHIFTADPSAHVFGDKIYIYPSHDLKKDKAYRRHGDQYDMEDYHVLSMDDVGKDAVDHGEALNLKDVAWAGSRVWAPDVACINGK